MTPGTEAIPRQTDAVRKPAWRKPLLAFVKLALLAIVLRFVGREIWRQLAEVTWREVTIQPGMMTLAVIALVLVCVITVAVRRLLLAGFCQPPSWPAMAAITWVPMLGKFIPGKVFGVAGVIWMLRRYGVRETIAVGLVFMANGLSVAIGLCLAIPLTLWPPVASRLPLAWLLAVVILAGFLLCLHPRSFTAISNRVLSWLGRPKLAMTPRLRDYAVPVLLMFVNWLLTGVALWLIARSMTDVSISQLPIVVATTALAASVGLLAFFAPAGVGVRDGIQLFVLMQLIGPKAAVAVLIMRLIQTLADVVLAGVGSIIQKWLNGSERPGAQPSL